MALVFPSSTYWGSPLVCNCIQYKRIPQGARTAYVTILGTPLRGQPHRVFRELSSFLEGGCCCASSSSSRSPVMAFFMRGTVIFHKMDTKHTHTHTRARARTHARTHTHTHTHMRAHARTYARAHTHKHTHTHTRSHTRTHTCTHRHAPMVVAMF